MAQLFSLKWSLANQRRAELRVEFEQNPSEVHIVPFCLHVCELQKKLFNVQHPLGILH